MVYFVIVSDVLSDDRAQLKGHTQLHFACKSHLRVVPPAASTLQYPTSVLYEPYSIRRGTVQQQHRHEEEDRLDGNVL